MPLARAEDDRRGVVLHSDLALRREPRAEEGRAHAFSEAVLCEQEEVVDATAEDDERRDYTSLRRQEQRLARSTGVECLDIVRNHRLQIRRGIRTTDAHEVA